MPTFVKPPFGIKRSGIWNNISVDASFYLVVGRDRIGYNVMFRSCILSLPHFIFPRSILFCFISKP